MSEDNLSPDDEFEEVTIRSGNNRVLEVYSPAFEEQWGADDIDELISDINQVAHHTNGAREFIENNFSDFHRGLSEILTPLKYTRNTIGSDSRIYDLSFSLSLFIDKGNLDPAEPIDKILEEGPSTYEEVKREVEDNHEIEDLMAGLGNGEAVGDIGELIESIDDKIERTASLAKEADSTQLSEIDDMALDPDILKESLNNWKKHLKSAKENIKIMYALAVDEKVTKAYDDSEKFYTDEEAIDIKNFDFTFPAFHNVGAELSYMYYITKRSKIESGAEEFDADDGPGSTNKRQFEKNYLEVEEIDERRVAEGTDLQREFYEAATYFVEKRDEMIDVGDLRSIIGEIRDIEGQEVPYDVKTQDGYGKVKGALERLIKEDPTIGNGLGRKFKLEELISGVATSVENGAYQEEVIELD